MTTPAAPWMDRLLPGSWRAVPFWVEAAHSLQGGRRLAVHELPERDDALVEDLGRKTRRFQVEFVGLARDYFSWRDEMREALEEPGPGDLSHPYLGELRVHVEDFTLTEDPRELGLFRVDATFVEATSALRVVTEFDLGWKTKEAAEAIVEPAKEALVAVAAGEEALPGLVDELVVELRGMALPDAAAPTIAPIAALEELLSAAASALDLTALAQSLVDLVMAMVSASAEAATGSPVVPERQLVSVAQSMAELGEAWSDPTAGAGSAPTSWQPMVATARELGAAADQRAVLIATRAAAFSAASLTSVEVAFESGDGALELATALDGLAESILALRPPLELGERIASLRAANHLFLRRLVADLPRRATYTPETTVPALVVAQRLYGDARRYSEIVRLNNLANPLFCQGGVPLTVLVDA